MSFGHAGDLPGGWVWASLDQVFASITDGDHQPPPQVDNGVPFLVIGNLQDGHIDFSQTRFVPQHYFDSLLDHRKPSRGDVLYTVTGSFGIPVLVKTEKPFCVQRHIAILKSPLDDLSAYMAYALSTSEVFRQASSVATGTAQKTVGLKHLREIRVPVAPLPEQHRIVSVLDSYFSRLDEAILFLERVQRNLTRYRAAVLNAAVTGKLVPTEAELARQEGRDYEPASELLKRILVERRRKWEEAELARMSAAGKPPQNDAWKAKYQEPTGPDTSGLPELPEGWCWASLDQLLAGIEAGKNFKCLERPPGEGETGVVKVSAVTWGVFDEEESKTCPRAYLVNPNLFIKEGDLLLSRANTVELVGACVIAGRFSRQLMLSDKILRLRIMGGLEPWVLWALRSFIGRSEIESLATGNQESMRNISQASIRSIRLPLPPPAEQLRVLDSLVRHVSLDENTAHVTSFNLGRVRSLRQALLKSAFEGKLVNQDPADEPASVLLERIKAERAAQAAEKPTKAKRGPRRRSAA